MTDIMQGLARAKFCRGSARKMRRVAALVVGQPVDHATAMLKLLPKHAATPLAKVIKSATANALAIEGTAHHKTADFVVAEVQVDGGPIMRRFRAVGMGRAYRIRKRFCHIRVIVSDEVKPVVRRRLRPKTAVTATPSAPARAVEKPAKTDRKEKKGKPA